MIRTLFDLLGERIVVPRLPRRWDGMNLSSKGTLASGFRVVEGTLPGVGLRWAMYATTIGPGHVWIARTSMHVQDVSPQLARPPHGRELRSLHRDFVVLPVLARSGARLEWAFRASELDDVLARLKLTRAD